MSPERVRAGDDCPELEERLRGCLDRMLDAVLLCSAIRDRRGRIVDFLIEYANDAARALGRARGEEQVGRRLLDVHPAHREDGLFDEYCRVVESGEPFVKESRAYAHAGARRRSMGGTFDIRVVKLGDGFVATWRDVTERKRFEGRLQRLADRDALTGLYNRGRFVQELRRELSHVDRYAIDGALLLLGLDKFKYVNDTLGHRVGDQLLATIADVLRGRLRQSDTLARLGGDEFAVLLPHTAVQQARDVAEQLAAAVRSEAIVLTGTGRPVSVTASVGVAALDGRGETGAGDVLALADLALSDAKEGGRNRVSVYEPEQAHREQMEERATWAERIRDALAGDGFVLHLQPIVELRTGAVAAHEVLLRMRSPDGELVMPGEFLAIAEAFGLARAVDRWVIGAGVRLLAEEQRRNGRALPMSINLCAQSITDPEVTGFIHDTIAASAIDPRDLTFEITEWAAIANLATARTVIEQLRDLGCHFALDDFGAGFGSFYYLKYLPFDFLKIDGEFISNLPASRADQLVVKAIAETARGLGKQTIAEYVSDRETVELLQAFGVDYGQGYHLGRPGPPPRSRVAVAQ